jgi:hypothetical protein
MGHGISAELLAMTTRRPWPMLALTIAAIVLMETMRQ